MFVRRLAVLAQEVTKGAHMFLQAPIGHEAAVAGENFGLRQIRRGSIFVRIAEDEFAGLQGRALEPGVGASLLPSITGCDSRSR